MKNIALVTNTEWNQLTEDDRLLLDPLVKNGFKPNIIIWDDKDVNWNNFSAIVIRSTWGYYREIEKYLLWLDVLEKRKVNLWNPAKTLRWNADKKYLIDLESKGVPIIPTILIEKNLEKDNIEKIIRDKKWNEIVVKPTFGAGGNNILHGNTKEMFLDDKISDLLKTSGVLIQPLMQEVVDEGEYSFIFIGGNYSHAMIKIQTSKELNVTRRFSVVEKTSPSLRLIEQAKKIFESLPQPLLYARIDGINIKGKFHLIETELIEPILYFKSEPGSSIHFVDAILKTI